MSPLVRLECAGPLARLTLDRPPLNVLNIEMLRQLEGHLVQLRQSKVKVIVLGGKGKAFCAGVDVADHTPDKVGVMIQAFHDVFRALWRLPQPLLAAVGGPALGGGMELAIACDLILAAQQACFGQPEVKVGVFPPLAALLLPPRVGSQAALECVLCGETWSGARAYELGLVNAVVPLEQLERTVEDWVGRLCALSAPVVRLAKQATLIGAGHDVLQERLARIERLYLEDLMRLDDAREGLQAFMDKRKPHWRDR